MLTAMALAHCALSLPSSPQNSIHTRKTLISVFSAKPTKRKNHLRPKLLKTLTKPYPQQTLEIPNETLKFPYEEELELTLQEAEIDEQNEMNLQNLCVSEASDAVAFPEAQGIVTKRSVFELVLYIVGLFVVQTVCTVWVLRSGNEEEEAELGDLGTEMLNGKKKEAVWFNRSKEVISSNVVHVDNSQLKEKIVEIRTMAREVRDCEAKKLSKNDSVSSDVIGVDGDESVSNSKVKTNIQKEVDGRLSKLEKRLRSLREKSITSKVSYLNNNSDEVKDKKELKHSDAKVKDAKLVFKKKLRFKSPPDKPRNSPKGFQSDDKYSMVNGNGRTNASQDAPFRSGSNGSKVIDVSAREKSVDVPKSGSLGSTRTKEEKSFRPTDRSKLSNSEVRRNFSGKDLDSPQDIGRNVEKEGQSLETGRGVKTENTKHKSGEIQETSSALVKPTESSDLKTKVSSSYTRNVEDKPVVNKLGDKQTDIENGMWWLNLPYALAILLRRDSESEGPEGLYSLKMDDGSSSHIVAFEDRRDATNFCYILEAFFEELGDLSADVVPMSIKELKDAVKSNTMRIIVARKGQLQLYAGQPLADVEMTLRSFVE